MDHELQVSILKELMTQLDEGKNIDVGVQYKMPTTSYTCPEIAAKERESFFQDRVLSTAQPPLRNLLKPL